MKEMITSRSGKEGFSHMWILLRSTGHSVSILETQSNQKLKEMWPGHKGKPPLPLTSDLPSLIFFLVFLRFRSMGIIREMKIRATMRHCFMTTWVPKRKSDCMNCCWWACEDKMSFHSVLWQENLGEQTEKSSRTEAVPTVRASECPLAQKNLARGHKETWDIHCQDGREAGRREGRLLN